MAFSIAYSCVGDLYHSGAIDGRTSGSFLHWLIRAVLFIAPWAMTYGAFAALNADRQLGYGVVLCVESFAVAGIVATVALFIRSRKKKPEAEVSTDA